MRFITTSGPEQTRSERELADQDEYNRILLDHFGIVMPPRAV